jgi:hypothetical protein
MSNAVRAPQAARAIVHAANVTRWSRADSAKATLGG